MLLGFTPPLLLSGGPALIFSSIPQQQQWRSEGKNWDDSTGLYKDVRV